MKKIFLSHSSKDKAFVRRLANDLRTAGLDPWFDEWEIRVGDSIPAKINAGLEDADCVVLVMSRQAVQSEWVAREWMARYVDEADQRNIAILPVLIEDCQIPTLLKPKKYADFRTDYELAFLELLRSIEPGSMVLSGVSASRAPILPAPADGSRVSGAQMRRLLDSVCALTMSVSLRPSVLMRRRLDRTAAVFSLDTNRNMLTVVASRSTSSERAAPNVGWSCPLFDAERFRSAYNRFVADRRGGSDPLELLSRFRRETSGFTSAIGLAMAVERTLSFDVKPNLFFESTSAMAQMIAIPLMVEGRKLGVLSLSSTRSLRLYDRVHLQLAEVIGLILAMDAPIGPDGHIDPTSSGAPLSLLQQRIGIVGLVNQVRSDFQTPVEP